MTTNIYAIADRLWRVADELRANSPLRSYEYSVPVLGLIFLRFADARFTQAEHTLLAEYGDDFTPAKEDFQARGVPFVPPAARFSSLLTLPDAENLGKAINDAMRAIEANNDDLRGVLPRTYTALDNSTLNTLLRTFSTIPADIEGDAFGRIYEYFLAKFAAAEGSLGGEFFTPVSLVRLIVEVIEPYHGRIYDPACGSGGMFVQSAGFVESHRRVAAAELSIFGQEKTEATVRLGKMNLALHGLSGDIRKGNSYYEDFHHALGKFDFVMANPPFNVNNIDKEKLKGDPRFPFGLPRADNGNYLWMQLFYSSLNETGRAGFVMSNAASDARDSEREVRQRLIEARAVDVMIAIGPNMFYTVSLACTLWFFDRAKATTSRRDTVLFIDVRHIYHQVDRTHRELTPAQIEFIANIARHYRGEPVETTNGSAALLTEHFPDGQYIDTLGLCKVATLAEIEAQGWSLNPGRYVGVTAQAADEFVFSERLGELYEELEVLSYEARELEGRIGANVAKLLEGVA